MRRADDVGQGKQRALGGRLGDEDVEGCACDPPGRKSVVQCRLVDQAAARIRASGKFLASTLYPGRTVADMFAEGYDLVLAGKDTDFVINGARALAASRD